MKKNCVFFRNRDEAEAKTGYFAVSSVMITWDLSEKISHYIHREQLGTFWQPNQAKTSKNTYTLNFTLKQYDDPRRRRAYLSKPGAVGYYHQHLKAARLRANAIASSTDHSRRMEKEQLLRRLEELPSRTPSLEQLYFWMVQKYPSSILWMDYSIEGTQRNSLDGDFEFHF